MELVGGIEVHSAVARKIDHQRAIDRVNRCRVLGLIRMLDAVKTVVDRQQVRSWIAQVNIDGRYQQKALIEGEIHGPRALQTRTVGCPWRAVAWTAQLLFIIDLECYEGSATGTVWKSVNVGVLVSECLIP